jgi:hypothetical protein
MLANQLSKRTIYVLLVLPVQQDKMSDNPNNLLVINLRIGIIQLPRQRFVENHSEPRDQNADARPPAKTHPAVHHHAAAERVETYRAGE